MGKGNKPQKKNVKKPKKRQGRQEVSGGRYLDRTNVNRLGDFLPACLRSLDRPLVPA